MNKEAQLSHIMTCFAEECGEVTQELGKIQRLGLHFKRDRRHANVERLQMEAADWLGAFEEFMLTLTGDHNWSEKWHEEYADRIHKKRMTIRMECLVKVELGMETVPPQFFNSTVEFYSKTEWWFEEHCQLQVNHDLSEEDWVAAQDNLLKTKMDLLEEATHSNNPYIKVIWSHFDDLVDRDECPFPHNYEVISLS